MKVLNLYHSTTGNTTWVVEAINKTVRELGHEIDAVKVSKDLV